MTVGKAACALAMSATKTARKVVVRNMSAKVRAFVRKVRRVRSFDGRSVVPLADPKNVFAFNTGGDNFRKTETRGRRRY